MPCKKMAPQDSHRGLGVRKRCPRRWRRLPGPAALPTACRPPPLEMAAVRPPDPGPTGCTPLLPPPLPESRSVPCSRFRPHLQHCPLTADTCVQQWRQALNCHRWRSPAARTCVSTAAGHCPPLMLHCPPARAATLGCCCPAGLQAQHTICSDATRHLYIFNADATAVQPHTSTPTHELRRNRLNGHAVHPAVDPPHDMPLRAQSLVLTWHVHVRHAQWSAQHPQ